MKIKIMIMIQGDVRSAYATQFPQKAESNLRVSLESEDFGKLFLVKSVLLLEEASQLFIDVLVDFNLGKRVYWMLISAIS